jgi:hypothetical protein
MGFPGIYLLVNYQFASWKITMFNGYINELNGPCSMAMLNYQRVVHVFLKNPSIAFFEITRLLYFEIASVSTKGLTSHHNA